MNTHCLKTSVRLMALFLLVALAYSVAVGQVSQKLVGEASGTITIRDLKGRKDVELKHVYAVKRDVGGPDESFIYLLFTDRPVASGFLERKRYVQIMAAEKQLNSLVVILDKNQKLQGAYLYFDGFSCMYDDVKGDHPYYQEHYAKFGMQVFDGQFVEAQQLIRGIVYSAQPTKICTSNDEITWQYRLSFTAKLEMFPTTPKPSTRVGEIAKAYNTFHKAVEAEDFEAIKQMLAADVVSSFAGTDSKTRARRLKVLLGQYRYVHNVELYDSGKVADFEIFKRSVRSSQLMPIPESYTWYLLLEEPPRTKPLPPPPAKKTASPPPPPPPPSPAAPIVRLEPRDFTIRMSFEEGQWKVYWLARTLAGFGEFTGNVLLHLDTYKSHEQKRP